MEKNQREYYLREQIKVIQAELGEEEDMIAEADNYKKKISSLNLKKEDEEKLIKEANRLTKLQYTSPESGIIRNYLDICLELPWNKTSRDNKDLKNAEQILNADHYGLEKVKERM